MWTDSCFILIVCWVCLTAGPVSGRRRTGGESSAPKAMLDPHLFQGDIVLLPTDSSVRSVADSTSSVFTSVLTSPADSRMWPDGIVYYQFSLQDPGLRNLVRRAMTHIEKRTCVRFQVRGFMQRLMQKQDYITIFRGKGCYSVVGRGRGSQPLSLGPGCENEAIIVHELMHAIGFFHLHSRSDRDQYLDIYWHNIEKKMWPQFEKTPLQLEPRDHSVFDYMSVMLYGGTTFSMDDFSTTISRKDGGRLIDVQFKNGLSRDDITAVNRMYNCPAIPDVDDSDEDPEHENTNSIRT